MPTKSKLRRPPSLALRLTILIGTGITLVFLAFGWVIERSIDYHFVQQDAAQLQAVAHAVQQALKDSPRDAGKENAPERRGTSAITGYLGTYFRVSDANGNVLYSSPGSGPDLSSLARTATPSPDIDASTLYRLRDGEKSYRAAVIQFAVDSIPAGAPLTLVVATEIGFHMQYLATFERTLWFAAGIAYVIAILSVWLAVYNGHAPLRRMSAKIRGINSSQLDVRLIPCAVPIELEELAVSFNNMLERIEDVFQRLSNFSADIAHELRTPITNLTTQTQVVLSQERSAEQYRETLYSDLEEYERMAKMVGDMLFLAQADNKLLKPELVTVDLVAEVRGLYDYFEAWAEERAVSLRLEGSALCVHGDQLMMRRALSNLLSNAIRYTPNGQAVTVFLDKDNTDAVIRVTNPDCDTASEHLPRLFDRFYRADASRQRNKGGAGLGLAIVKSIVDAHGGSISASCADGLMTFKIRLPETVCQAMG